jgi:formate-dependent nitrite reductase cytochrome c552 subunit
LPEANASVKAGKVECVGCHDLSKKQTLENIASACTQCHDKAYVDMLKGWKEETLEAQKKTKDLLERANKKLMDALKAKRSVGEAAGLLEQGKKAYEFVAQAKGVHNAELAGSILEQVQKDVQKAEELLTSPGAKGGK